MVELDSTRPPNLVVQDKSAFRALVAMADSDEDPEVILLAVVSQALLFCLLGGMAGK